VEGAAPVVEGAAAVVPVAVVAQAVKHLYFKRTTR